MLTMKVIMGVRPALAISIYGKEPLMVELGKALNRRELAKTDNSYDILVRYLNYAKMDDEYYNGIDRIFSSIVLSDFNSIVQSASELIDRCTKDTTIQEFLKYEDYKAPNNLADKFDEGIIFNREGSREQTYIKQDYIDLVCLSIKAKALSPIIARYIYIHELKINTSSAMVVYRLINGIKSISGMAAYIKLMDFIIKNVGTSDDDIARVLTKDITSVQFPAYILVAIIIYIGVVGTSDNDTDTHSIVNDAFRLCKNKTAPTKSIMFNNPDMITDEDGNSAATDTYVSTSQVTLGAIEEIRWSFRDMENILHQVRRVYTIDPTHLLPSNDKNHPLHVARAMMIKNEIDHVQKALLCWLFFEVMESEWRKLFTRETMADLRLVAYAVLKTNHLDLLADLMISGRYEMGGFINNTIKKTNDEIETYVKSLFGVTISKKSKVYGLNILSDDEIDTEDEDSIMGLLINPVIKRGTTFRWVAYHTGDVAGTVYVIPNMRELVLKTIELIQKDK